MALATDHGSEQVNNVCVQDGLRMGWVGSHQLRICQDLAHLIQSLQVCEWG